MKETNPIQTTDESKNRLIVSEHFFSLQGEGSTMGRPSVFLRLTGCNLMCGGIGGSLVGKTATWWCDTEPVWRKGKKHDFIQLFELFKNHGYIDRLKAGAHLIVTGGEPMLQMEQIISFLGVMMVKGEFDKLPTLEIETNGVMYHPHLQTFDHINVSPKLSNSGESFEKRMNFDSMIKIHSLPSSIFKFVVSCKDDIDEIKFNYGWIHPSKIWLMPSASSQKELEENLPLAAEQAIENGWNLSSRLHVQIWNQLTGV